MSNKRPRVKEINTSKHAVTVKPNFSTIHAKKPIALKNAIMKTVTTKILNPICCNSDIYYMGLLF